jgi:integrase
MEKKKLELEQAVFHLCKGYPGVRYLISAARTPDGKPERVYYIRYRTPDGRQHFEKAGHLATTPAKAAGVRRDRARGMELPNQERREEKKAAAKAASEAEEGRWTFDRLWKEWKTSNANKKGIVNDDNRYRNHLQGPFGGKEPKDVVPLDVDRLKAKLLRDPANRPGRKFNLDAKRRSDYSPETIRKLAEKSSAKKGRKKPYEIGTVVSILSLLRRIASFGVKRQLCEGLSFTVEIPKGARQKTESMTEEQLARYIRTCREWADPQDGNFQLLQIFTGMRRGEVRNLKWADVDFEQGFILIRDPKGGEDVKVPISKSTGELLQGHLKEIQRIHKLSSNIDETKGLLEEGFQSAYSVVSNSYVFPGEKGGPRGLRQIDESSRAIRDAAGLPADFRPNHGLRHSFASTLANSGEADLYLIQTLLGHKDPKTTMRYSHLANEALKRGASIMSRIAEAAVTAEAHPAPDVDANESAS